MSKKVEATVSCPNCGHRFTSNLYRTIWGEYPKNRELVFNDNINTAICSECEENINIPFPFLYVDMNKQFAVWYEPEHDPNIDKDKKKYRQMFGAGNFYETAPRVKSWKNFKETIKKFEDGRLKANPIKISDEQKDNFEETMKDLIKDLENEAG